MKLSVFQQHHEVNTLSELRKHLKFRHQDSYASFWLFTDSETKPSLGVFINGEHAVAFYIRESGDPGFYSVDPESNESNPSMDFLIDNFQSDYYPMYMVIPADDAILAMEQFLQLQELPDAIQWFES